MSDIELFLSIWFVIVISLLLIFFLKGKRALASFPDLKSVHVVFREKSASGNALKNVLTKLAGVNNTLDVIVTNEEFWLKSPLLLAGAVNRFGLLHKVSLKNIYKVEAKGKKVQVEFKSKTGETVQVLLLLKNPEDFIKAIQ